LVGIAMCLMPSACPSTPPHKPRALNEPVATAFILDDDFRRADFSSRVRKGGSAVSYLGEADDVGDLAHRHISR